MSYSTILISSDSARESVGSSPSLAASAAVVTSPIATLDLAIESDLEAEPSEAPPSPDYSEPIEDAPEVAEPLSAQPPLPLGYRAAIARWSAALLSTPYLSHTLEDSTSLSGSPLDAPSVPYSRPSSRRSRPISSSSGTSRPSSGPLPRRRYLVLSYSTLSVSVEPSHKRCRSPTTSRPATTSAPTILSSVLVDRLPPCKRLRGSLAVSYQDVTIEAIAEPDSPPTHQGLTVEERLDEQSKAIREMYEHLLDMPLLGLRRLRRNCEDWTCRDATPGERHCKAVTVVLDCSDSRQRAHLEDRGVPSPIYLGLG
ncbi:hypothetical protein Tco_1576645 [Tanacetum coccineum]